MRRNLTYLLVLMVIAALVAAAVGTAIASPDAGTSRQSSRSTTAAQYSPDAEECAFLNQINAYRDQNNREPLTLLRTLGAAAEHHSVDMAVNNYWHDDHTLFDGTTFSQNIVNHGSGLWPFADPRR